MTSTRGRLGKGPLALLWLAVSVYLLTSPSLPVACYTPILGHQTHYDYGFINTGVNLTADDINFWTGLSLSESNYTMRWHQHVNLTISVISTSPATADYRYNVTILNNVVTISNTSWESGDVILNASVSTPSPTVLDNGTHQYPIGSGLPDFFLDDTTLASITMGNNVMIGNSLWETITNTTFTLGESTEACYQLQNTTTIANTRYETRQVIDQDVGIYYSNNETRILSYGALQGIITYYYRVVATNIPLFPPPNPLITILIIVLIAVIIITVIILLWHYISRRRRRVQLPPQPEPS